MSDIEKKKKELLSKIEYWEKQFHKDLNNAALVVTSLIVTTYVIYWILYS